jgi:hypothetical protein
MLLRFTGNHRVQMARNTAPDVKLVRFVNTLELFLFHFHFYDISRQPKLPDQFEFLIWGFHKVLWSWIMKDNPNLKN